MPTTRRCRLLGFVALLLLAALVTPALFDGTARADTTSASKQLFLHVIGHHPVYRVVINLRTSLSHRPA
ncbi:hypothetical protein ABT247_09915 [Kitasatospora sp. NPDC001539]|uniref:hypothetical protein n=1 Tax=unclassified Kitasatospora TaxID=2633591 RepID=UPI0033184E5C